ncbi:hypothetical protein CDL15_Pgr021826 [Punica granatum]|uniref:BHLH domain-containing protein n=1 Tax=Punica granatum TaxID=22663 RepID=A0A218WTX5_PUNGR|nr:hypothetical protein CDL15_Pgr021826 [Punica granatum]
MRRVSFAWVRTTLTQPSNLQSSCKGFHIAFINIEFNHRLMVNSREGYGFLNSEFEIFVNVALTRPFVSWPRNAWRSSAQLCPNYSLPKPFVSGQTTNDSNKAREDADGDEENKKKKTRHREIERQRRKEMNTLYASLRSLLPAQILKGKRTISDQLNVALDYINQIQRNIKKLETERARLKKINNELKGDADAGLGYQEVMSTGSCSISVQPYSSGGVEIVVHSSHEEKPLPLSGVIQVLVDEGMDVVCCASTQVNDAIVHTIQSKVI